MFNLAQYNEYSNTHSLCQGPGERAGAHILVNTLLPKRKITRGNLIHKMYRQKFLYMTVWRKRVLILHFFIPHQVHFPLSHGFNIVHGYMYLLLH